MNAKGESTLKKFEKLMRVKGYAENTIPGDATVFEAYNN